MNIVTTTKSKLQPIASIKAQLTAKIMSKDYPCIGAKSAVTRELSTLCVVNDLTAKKELETALQYLYAFSENAHKSNELFHSFILACSQPLSLSDDEFETLLWSSLQVLHDLDKKNYKWCQDVSNDPDSDKFSMSLGEEAFFVIGMHANASRKVRRFAYPLLVFNRHAQFETLRSKGQFNKLRNMIRQRDLNYSGSVNPLLDDYGSSSEARQYSGKAVKDDWRCPFHAH